MNDLMQLDACFTVMTMEVQLLGRTGPLHAASPLLKSDNQRCAVMPA